MRITFPMVLLFLLSSAVTFSQKKRKAKNKETTTSLTYNNLSWRNIGPFRGGRSVASTGVVKESNVFYMGSTGGGVWKTEDYGIQWKNISDGYFKTGTVGAIAVSESDPNVVVVGMGEHAARGVMTSMGDGVYKSEDAGATWKHIGLEQSRHIANIQIHPTNPDIFYVAVQGAQYGPNKERGVYKTEDGGKTWQKVLYVNELVGAASLSMDMNNPRILYAAMWDHKRTPWQMRSGGPDSGIYKTTNGGANWTRLEKGLPEVIGKAGISVSRANSKRVFINLEAEGAKSGVYRSDDSGSTWKQVNKDRIAVTRSWYYMEIFADPQDENKVYVLNAPALKSIDGGNTFQRMATPHGDNHHLWIHPNNNKLMINSNDGGANVSLNGGQSWSTQQNQPTSQFYRVIADAQVPYHVYGGQQDNSAIGIKSRDSDSGIDWKDWYSVAGCESAFLAFDPKNPEVVYGGCYQGIIERWHRATQSGKAIKEYPELALGNLPKEFKYRFNWNAPILRLTSSCPVAASTGRLGELNRAIPTGPCRRASSWLVACVRLWPTSPPSVGKSRTPSPCGLPTTVSSSVARQTCVTSWWRWTPLLPARALRGVQCPMPRPSRVSWGILRLCWPTRPTLATLSGPPIMSGPHVTSESRTAISRSWAPSWALTRAARPSFKLRLINLLACTTRWPRLPRPPWKWSSAGYALTCPKSITCCAWPATPSLQRLYPATTQSSGVSWAPCLAEAYTTWRSPRLLQGCGTAASASALPP